MKTKHLEHKRKALIQKREDLIGNFGQAARGHKEVERIVGDIALTNDFLESLENIATENEPDATRPRRYTVSSFFLHESFKKLTADADEQFFFITGSEVEG